MLQELVIQDFAIIEKLDLSFKQGMTVLSGETGAGKSIIIDAVGLIAGGRASQDFIRTGAKKALLQGMFVLPKHSETAALLEELGIDSVDDTVILQREISFSGHNVCRINGQLVNTTILKKVGETLVDIHGQNEHQSLMNETHHIDLLDEFGQEKQHQLLQDYQESFQKFNTLKKAFEQQQNNEQEWAQRLDMLEFQKNEIASAQLVVDEFEQLETQKNRLSHYQKINQTLQDSYQSLQEGPTNILDQLAATLQKLQQIETLDSEYQEMVDNVQNSYYVLQEVNSDIARHLDNLEWDADKLEMVQQRLELINQLKHKYGQTIADVLAYEQKITTELQQMQNSEATINDLKQNLKQQEQLVVQKAQKLTLARKKLAQQLTKQVKTQLAALYMDKTEFEVKFSANDQLTAKGQDKIGFYIQPNPGESLKPLAKIASGGELSRLMLALKTIFSQNQGITSIIFDEVDTGVSGRVAQAIAEKISTVASFSQVLCITHLPQVAAMADHQYQITKKIIQNRTETTVQKLTDENRIEALAKMLASSEVTDLTRQHAKELLELAKKVKRH